MGKPGSARKHKVHAAFPILPSGWSIQPGCFLRHGRCPKPGQCRYPGREDPKRQAVPSAPSLSGIRGRRDSPRRTAAVHWPFLTGRGHFPGEFRIWRDTCLLPGQCLLLGQWVLRISSFQSQKTTPFTWHFLNDSGFAAALNRSEYFQ